MIINNMRTGKTFAAGEINVKILVEALTA